jgi:hypothetical protein
MNGSQDAGGAHPAHHARGATADPRSRVRLGLSALALVAVAAGALVAVLRGGGPVPGPAPVVLPPPTPTLAAAPRDTTTAFQRALPDEVLAFAVASQVVAPDLLDAGAVEAYELGYSDGAQQVTLRAAQWPTADEAITAMSTLLATARAPDATAPAPRTTRDEPVAVGGEAVGRVIVVVDGATAAVTWTNGSTLFRLEGPAGAVPALYDAFPM